ncbi:hypothetical protein E3G52_000290 [Mycobacteroides abscessus]|uniref:hypothetical protein n=1 Tax=Mycobacteroides abscessus TaxID=36809 RepID=UPI0018786680|nr:hypothetical protein [Mycobacteroides abscessus]MBE5453426.1 hypothetical protein [Mycobacteroides abscessus]
MSPRKKETYPGTISTTERADKSGFGWKWVSDKGDIHFNNGPFETKAKALGECKKWLRANVIKDTEDTGEDE